VNLYIARVNTFMYNVQLYISSLSGNNHINKAELYEAKASCYMAKAKIKISRRKRALSLDRSNYY